MQQTGFRALILGTLLAIATGVAHADPIPPVAEASNMQIIGHSNLNGVGKGGEGLALRQYPNGQRVLFLAHELAPMCFSVIDVTNPEDPKVIAQLPVEAESVRCNSLGLSGTTLAVAHQVEKAGQPHAGMDTYDVTDPAHPKKLSYFDTSGPTSRGVHYLWFADGQYAYLSTGAKDFTPHNKNDDQFLMIVDLADPAHPKETGRWWLPGTRVGDKEPPPPRVAPFDAGIRMHSPAFTPERPDRVYLGWIDGGLVILDIADKAHPKLVAHRSWQSVGNGFAHTLLPIPSRESADPVRGGDGGQLQGLAEARLGLGHERRDAPHPARRLSPASRFFQPVQGGWTVRRAQHRHEPTDEHVADADQDGGGQLLQWRHLCLFPRGSPHPVEIGYLIEAAPAGNATHTIQINDVYVDENGLIYANDRLSGGLDIVKYTGSVPLQ